MTAPVIKRQCGECNVCCTVLRIDDKEADFHKKAGVTCELLVAGKCSIHATKSLTCKGYYCMWMMGDGQIQRVQMSDAERPDKSGVIVSMNNPDSAFTKDTGLVTFAAYEARPNAFNEYWGEKIVKRLMQRNLLVLFRYEDMMKGTDVTPHTPFIGPPALVDILRGWERMLHKRAALKEIGNEDSQG